MKPVLVRALAFGLGLLLVPLGGGGQLSAQTEQYGSVAQPAGPDYTAEQLDQLLAPIALYPDALLSQILMAATYPLEVVSATRWVQDPNNARLRGDQLADVLEQQDWDPSVKSLVPFPQVLQMMNSKLDWMQALGNAFLAQEGDVMDSVQHLRAQARAAGTLRSTTQQVVSVEGPTIVVEPANPQVVYVPYYNPLYVYGPWPYPRYQPVYFPPWPNYGYVVGPGIFFGVAIGINDRFWGWDRWDWSHRRIHIDADRYNRINNYVIVHDNRPRYDSDTWRHDPYHRRGVPYRDSDVRAKFQHASPAPDVDARRDFRGFDRRDGFDKRDAGRPSPQPSASQRGRNVDAERHAEPSATERATPTARPETPRRASVEREKATPPESGRRPDTDRTVRQGRGDDSPRQSGARATSAPPSPAAPEPATTSRPAPSRDAPSKPATTRREPPAFSNLEKGDDAKVQSERGRNSRQTMPPAAAPRVASPPPQPDVPQAAAPRAAPPPPVVVPQSRRGEPQQQDAPATGDHPGNGRDRDNEKRR